MIQTDIGAVTARKRYVNHGELGIERKPSFGVKTPKTSPG